jgi:hypothetical protein
MLALWYVNSNLFKVYPVYPASIIYNSQIKYTQKKKNHVQELAVRISTWGSYYKGKWNKENYLQKMRTARDGCDILSAYTFSFIF